MRTKATLSKGEKALTEESLLGAKLLRPYYTKGIYALTPVAAVGLPYTAPCAVDRWWRLYLEFERFAELSLPERATCIAAHEVEHLLRRHFTRLYNAVHAELANIGGDLEINTAGMEGVTAPKGGLTPEMFGLPPGLLAEEYISKLKSGHADKHVHGTTCGGGSGAGKPLEGEFGESCPDVPTLSEVDQAVVIQEVASSTVNYAHHNPGTVPGHILLWATAQGTPPRISWAAALRRYLIKRAAAVKYGRDDYSWARLPRQVRSDVLRPGPVDIAPKLAVIVDTSGSMIEHGDLVLSRVGEITRTFRDVRWITCDAAITGAWTSLPTRWVGGGGTDLREGFNYLRKRKIHPDLILVITDGYTPWPTEQPSCPVAALLVGTDAQPRSQHPTPGWLSIITVE